MKSYLSTSQFEILSTLLRESAPITIKELSRMLNIKPRVIQYNLDAIGCWLEYNHVSFIRRSGFGLFIELPKKEKENLLEQLSKLVNIELILSKQERQIIMMIKIMISEHPVRSSTFEEEFSVSRTTIVKDIGFIKKLITQNQLALIKIPKIGYEIHGSKSKKRFMICKLICEEHFNKRIILGDLDYLIKLKTLFVFLFHSLCIPADTEFVKKIINKIENLLEEEISYTGYIFIFYYLLILLNDIRSDKKLEDINIKEFKSFKEALISHPVKLLIEAYTNKKITDSEIQLLVLHCHCQARSKRFVTDNDSEKKAKEMFIQPKRFVALNQSLMREISLSFNPYLQFDEIFQKELASLLERNVIYKKYGFSLITPFANEIRKLFPKTQDILERIFQENTYNKIIQLDRNEISILTSATTTALIRIQHSVQKEIKVILICDGDESINSIMKERIVDNFPWFDIVDIIRPIDFDKKEIKDANLIITTEKISVDENLHSIIVSPFILEYDIRQIKNWITEYAEQKNRALDLAGNLRIEDLLLEKNIIFAEKVENWQEAVFLAGDSLVECGAIDKGYLDAIIQLNKTYGPYSVVANKIALLHARPTKGVKRLCMGLLILKEGVHFGAVQFDPVNIIFIIGIQNTLLHYNTLRDLIVIIRKKEFCEALINCTTPEEAKHVIHSLKISS